MASKTVPATARRAEVARLRTHRLSTRQIAERIGVSQPTVVRDLAVLAEDWRKSYGDLADLLTQTAMDLDRWQARMESGLNALAADELPMALAALIRISDQRNKLFGLYPKPGSEAEPMPTGPITVKLQLIPGGNSKLITNSQDESDIIDVTPQHEPQERTM